MNRKLIFYWQTEVVNYSNRRLSCFEVLKGKGISRMTVQGNRIICWTCSTTGLASEGQGNRSWKYLKIEITTIATTYSVCSYSSCARQKELKHNHTRDSGLRLGRHNLNTEDSSEKGQQVNTTLCTLGQKRGCCSQQLARNES